MLKLILLVLITAAISQKVHDGMTVDEWIKNFPAPGAKALKYEIVRVYTTRLEKRDLHSGIHVQFTAFDENINLWVNPTDQILVGEKTPVYEIASKNVSDLKIFKYPNAIRRFKLYEDFSHGAIFITNTNISSHISMTGRILSNNIYIRPLPRDLDDHRKQQEKFVGTIIESKMGEYSYHVAYKIEAARKYSNSLLTTSLKSKRSILETRYVEILVIVDSSLYQLFNEKIPKTLFYLLPFWNGVDLIFRNIDNPRIRLNIAGIILAKDEHALQYMTRNMNEITGQINVGIALNDTRTCILENLESVIPMDSYDLAITMTSAALCLMDEENQMCIEEVLGHAFVGGACSVNKTTKICRNHGIIHDSAGYDGITTAAHELGHLLGAAHDGKTEHSEYLATEGYIMAPYPVFTNKSSDWSPGSLSDFENFLLTGGQCLLNKPDIGNPVHINLPGKLMNADQQCTKILGPLSRAKVYDKTICVELECLDPDSYNNSYKVITQSAAGTSCGHGKICLNSQCVNEQNLSLPDNLFNLFDP